MNLSLSVIASITLIPLFGAVRLYSDARMSFSIKEKLGIFLGGIVLLFLSLVINETKVAGTILQTNYGWPQSFLTLARSDVIDHTEINTWFFDKRWYLYVINFLFYLAITFFLVTVMKYRKK